MVIHGEKSQGWSEPDISPGNDHNETNWRAAGFNSYKEMAENLRDDYKNMIDSIKKYGGFYIGRYELGGTTEASRPVIYIK